jgi:uncharacterized repeat protein (TIGR02543 family)
VQDCAACFTCGCSGQYAGYYLAAQKNGTYYIRAGHDASGKYVGCLNKDTVVYVLGMNPNTGWAYIDYEGIRGHYQTKYLKKYYPAPESPVITTDQSSCIWGDNVTISWNKPAHAEEFRLQVYRDGELLTDELVADQQSYTLQSVPAGHYEVQVAAANRTGWSEPGVQKIWVRDTCTVTYDAAGGSGAPEAMTHIAEDVLKLPETVPVRQGYCFLGWTDEVQGNLAKYAPGGSLVCNDDLTLYAVWKEDSAQPETLVVEHLPNRTLFLLDEPLDTAGLVLRLTYTDGSAKWISDGFTTNGYGAEEIGIRTVTVECEGLTAVYDVEIVTHFPGDIDLNKTVDRDDVMKLLWHITFPEQFPIEVPADFTGDGKVDRDDVMQLLWHITFPDMFPLEK